MKNVWILTMSIFLVGLGYTMVIPFLPVYLVELGTGAEDVPLWSGLVFSVTFFVAAILSPLWGRLADKHGSKKMILRACAGLAITYALMGFVHTAWQLFVVRALQGVANGFAPAALTLVTISVPENRLGAALGIYQTGGIIGAVAGPFLGGLIGDLVGLRPAFFITGTFFVCIYIAITLMVKEPTGIHEKMEKGSLREDFLVLKKNKVFLEILALYFVIQASMLMLQPVLSLYVGQLLGSIDKAALTAGSILSMGGIAGAITTNVWSRWGQRRGYMRVIFYALTGVGIVTLLQGFTKDIYAFALLQILAGMFTVGVNPSMSAAVTECTQPENRGRAFGLTTTAQMGGNMMGPLFASTVMTFWGIEYVFLWTGTMLLCISYWVHRRL